MHLELPIASFIAAALSVAPLPWHWRSGTVPTISIALWLFVCNLINGVDTIIWAGNVDIVAVVWCDISTKINMGANLALPVSIFCLCLHLERVSSIRQISTDYAQRRKRLYFDLLMCFGLPMVYMATHYVVQGHRFDIIEDFGCRAATYVSVASIFLIWVPPLSFSLGAFILSGLAFRNFWNRRITFARHLQTSSVLTPSRYFRLMAMSLVQMFWGAGVIALTMWFTMRAGLRPWISWEDVHSNFSRIAVFPTIFIPKQALFYTYMLWWTVPISTFIFFAFFSFGQDAIKEYRACYQWIKSAILGKFPSLLKQKVSDSLPSHSLDIPDFKMATISKPDVQSQFSTSQITLICPLTPSSHNSYPWKPPPTSATGSPFSDKTFTTDMSSTYSQSVHTQCSTIFSDNNGH